MKKITKIAKTEFPDFPTNPMDFFCIVFTYQALIKKIFSSLLEKRDVDALEAGSDTHKLFLEQGDLDDQKTKEIAEYIDAKNKEVIYRELKNNIVFSLFLVTFQVSKACWTNRKPTGTLLMNI